MFLINNVRIKKVYCWWEYCSPDILFIRHFMNTTSWHRCEVLKHLILTIQISWKCPKPIPGDIDQKDVKKMSFGRPRHVIRYEIIIKAIKNLDR